MSSEQLLNNIKQAEGCRLKAYRDPLGYWTVGVGHKLAENKNWDGYVITSDTANGLLIIDVNQASYTAAALPEWTCLDTPARQDALIELIFNMGEGGWRKFVRTREAIQAKQWQRAYDGLLASLWASQVGPGRSRRIASQLLTGQQP